MKVLLDTHLLLWAAGDPSRLPPSAHECLTAPQHTLCFSAASLWEIVIKRSLGRDDFQVDPGALRRGLIDHGYAELPVDSRHAVAVSTLPTIHKDPFDRILVAQAQVEGVLLLTSDALVARYPGPIRLV